MSELLEFYKKQVKKQQQEIDDLNILIGSLEYKCNELIKINKSIKLNKERINNWNIKNI